MVNFSVYNLNKALQVIESWIIDGYTTIVMANMPASTLGKKGSKYPVQFMSQ